MDVFERIREMLAEQLEIEPEKITMESDILEDIKHAETTDTTTPREDSHRTSILSMIDEPLEEDQEEDDIEAFSSVAVHQLQETTNENARQLRKLSGVLDENVVNFLETGSDFPSPPKKRVRRRLPRASFSPKVASGGSPSRLSRIDDTELD